MALRVYRGFHSKTMPSTGIEWRAQRNESNHVPSGYAGERRLRFLVCVRVGPFRRHCQIASFACRWAFPSIIGAGSETTQRVNRGGRESVLGQKAKATGNPISVWIGLGYNFYLYHIIP
jgi:hypothetical protein